MIIVTGASGFLGRAVSARIPEAHGLSSNMLDLTDGEAVLDAFSEWKPSVVIHLAARVGGISENIKRPADFLIDNLRIDANVLNAMRVNPPEHFIPMLSTCMYPDRLADTRYPMDERDIEDGAPPPTNAAYAAAKRSLLHGTRALHSQYGVSFTALIPANLYGPGDHFGQASSHFLAAAVSKIESARLASDDTVEFFGTGRALRQYVFVNDVAGLVASAVGHEPINEALNVAPEQNRSIHSLAEAVVAAVGFDGRIGFDGKGPDGQIRKDVSSGRLRRAFPEWTNKETPLDEGLRRTIDWYREHVETR